VVLVYRRVGERRKERIARLTGGLGQQRRSERLGKEKRQKMDGLLLKHVGGLTSVLTRVDEKKGSRKKGGKKGLEGRRRSSHYNVAVRSWG